VNLYLDNTARILTAQCPAGHICLHRRRARDTPVDMRSHPTIGALLLSVVLIATVFARAAQTEPPEIPIGLDVYRQWEKWPVQRIGQRTYMRSTYDRRGGNKGADASHFLYQLRDDFNVTLDLEGPGLLSFVRYNHWHGSPWHYVIDGTDHLITETSTADPLHPKENSVFEPHAALPKPLAWTWADTRGADLIWVPMGFEKSFQMAYSRTRYGTGYYIYQRFLPGMKLSKQITAWDGKSPPDGDVVQLVGRSAAALEFGLAGAIESFTSQTIDLSKREVTPFIGLDGGPTIIRSIELRIPRSSALNASHLRLLVWWDRRPASVYVPIPLFFGAGTLYNRDEREELVRAFPVGIRFEKDEAVLTCCFPMPFLREAEFALESDGQVQATIPVHCKIRHDKLKEPFNNLAYFHATYHDHSDPKPGQDLVLLDTRETEGGGDWSGSFVGTSFIFSHEANLGTLEGDPRFYFDDSMTPQAQGTGTEEWGGGGDYWGGLNMTLPFAGHPVGAKSLKDAKSDLDKIESAYRFLLSDLFPFGKNARITLEHGGTNESTQHYETIAYWYGLPAASLVKTDELAVGDEASEHSHGYESPQASAPYELKSRYEWGVDIIKGAEIFPATSDRGRTTTGTSEFTLKLVEGNLGVLLRRKLDYQFPNQRAEISVAPAGEDGKPTGEFQPAGIWYLAGSNTCVYSNPRDELGATQHTVQTSNRRFRDDEFLIGPAMTQGRSAIRVRVKFTPVNIPLYPGAAIPDLAWSEMRYTAYCYVMPRFALR
jgi:hypothetical protein